MIATPILPGPSPVAGKPLAATFDAGRARPRTGVIVLREIAARLEERRARDDQAFDEWSEDRVLRQPASAGLNE